MCMYMFMCVYNICVHVCTCLCACSCVHVHVRTCLCACSCIRVHVCTCLCPYVHVHMVIYMSVHTCVDEDNDEEPHVNAEQHLHSTHCNTHKTMTVTLRATPPHATTPFPSHATTPSCSMPMHRLSGKSRSKACTYAHKLNTPSSTLPMLNWVAQSYTNII